MMKGCSNKQDGRRITEGDDVGKNTSNDFQLNNKTTERTASSELWRSEARSRRIDTDEDGVDTAERNELMHCCEICEVQTRIGELSIRYSMRRLVVESNTDDPHGGRV
jgi:hypothetical protein